jgi:hypothetical protein
MRFLSAEKHEHVLATIRRNRAVTEAWQSGGTAKLIATAPLAESPRVTPRQFFGRDIF